MADQSFLDGVRSQAGFGGNYTRPQYSRSADQNNTISGNQGYMSQMPQGWQPQLASNIDSYRNMPAFNPNQPGGQGWGNQQSQMQARAQGMTPLQYAQQQPGADQNAINAAMAQAQGGRSSVFGRAQMAANQGAPQVNAQGYAVPQTRQQMPAQQPQNWMGMQTQPFGQTAQGAYTMPQNAQQGMLRNMAGRTSQGGGTADPRFVLPLMR